MTSLPSARGGGPLAVSTGTDAQTQTEAAPGIPITTSPPSETVRANQIRQSYRPPHQLKSPDATHAGSAALLAAQHTSSPSAWTYEGNAGASAAASLARANSKPIEAWKPNKLSSAGAAASLAHRASISEKKDSKEASASASAALRSPTRSSFESHEPAQLAVSSADASLTNSAAHAMRAASMAHKPSLSKSPEQVKASPTHALKAASAADRDSTVQKSPSPTYYRSPDESARIQKLARELARRELEQSNAATGGVNRSDLTRIASLSMARKTASDQAEQEKIDARKRQVQEEAMSEWNHQNELDEAARRIVAERIARVTLTGDEGDEVLAGKAAGESIHRGDKRVKDWERVLQQMDNENKSDRERNMGWLRHSMRQSAPLEPSKNDPAAIMAAAQRNVQAQMDGMDKSIAQEYLVLGKPTGENAARRDAYTKDLEQKGTADLQRVQKERASTYDIGGMIMTHEQVEAIAQKHVNEVLAEINEKVEREKERIEKERIERETKLREKQEEKDAAREKAAQEKAEKEKIKAEHREQKAEEKRQKEEEKRAKEEAKAAEKRKKEEELAAEKRKKEEELAAERKRKEDELNAQKELNAVQKEQLALGEGVSQHDVQMEQKESAQSEPKASSEGLAEAVQANTGVIPETVDEDGKGKGIKSWFKTKVGRRLSRNAQDMEPAPATASGSKTESKSKEDLYGTFPVASNWIEPSRPREESLRDVALAKHTDDVPSETHEEPVEEDHEIDDIAGYKPEGYETPEYVSEDEKFDDAVEEFKEGSSPTSVAKEAEKKVSVDKGSRFKEEF